MCEKKFWQELRDVRAKERVQSVRSDVDSDSWNTTIRNTVPIILLTQSVHEEVFTQGVLQKFILRLVLSIDVNYFVHNLQAHFYADDTI